MKLKIKNHFLAALLTACFTAPFSHAAILVTETFGGTGSGGLNGTTADTFNAAITTAGGSSTWAADGSLLDNGTINTASVGNRVSAHLNLGTYINDAKNTAAGKFVLTTTITTTTGNWLSVGFAQTGNTGSNFSVNTGYGNILVRATGDIDQYRGANTGNEVTANDTIIGNTNQTVTITWDFTPGGGYNGTTNFGNVVFSVAGVGGYTTAPSVFTANAPIQFLTLGWGGLTNPGPVTGSYASLSLTQIPEPNVALLGGLGLLGLLRRRR
ncbi:MAG: PEP-CTERM sorting domain-containing protein [Verrucomicrobiota bacterium]